ncbi:MAG: PAS domain-containing protein [Wujia sp.]
MAVAGKHATAIFVRVYDMILENKYLRKAIQKSGYVVIVKTCHRNERKSKLEYISPNASELGINIELLNKGLKLTEDYIHPEDRQQVIQTMVSAIESKVDDYVHDYRMVGDDGRLYYVSNEICVSDINDTTFTVEFYIKNARVRGIGNNKNAVATQNSGEKPAMGNATGNNIDLSHDERVKTTISTFASLVELYSIFVDDNCKILYSPTGPATNLGDFYDMFEKPAYKEYFKHIKEVVEVNDSPSILEREEGGIGKISPAPIKVGDELKGYWILGSYTAEETETLNRVYREQWMIADMLSQFLSQRHIVETEVAKSKGAGKKLRNELARQSIINDALTKINSKLIDSIDQVVEETLRDVGINLNADKVFLYTVGKSSYREYNLKSYWDVSGAAFDESIERVIPDYMYLFFEGIRKENGTYTIDNSNITEDTKLVMLRFNFKALIVQPIYSNNHLHGVLFFAECKSERVWTGDEVRFAKSIALVIENMLENAEGDDNIRKVNKHLIDTYNNFNVGVFIRNLYTGEVLFSNKKMNEMLGYDFVGGDSKNLLTDLHDRFDNISGMRKPFITKEKIANWRSYIKSLDGIMDITEIQMEWLQGEPASLIILREAKDL